MHTTDAKATALVHRWQRIQMHVRCGLSAHQPGCVRAYVHTGLQLARSGALPALAVHLRMLQTLLQTAQDQGLPWFWRSVCLEHVNLPLAKLTSLIGLHDPLAMQAIEAAVQSARSQLPAWPSAPRDAACP